MFRLVFRPFTQIRRTICTSVTLQASTRVSSGFTLFKQRSTSFGSQQIRSCSNRSRGMVGRLCGFLHIPTRVAFTMHPRFATLLLAYLLDSLVRVSRRVDKNHFASIRAEMLVRCPLAHTWNGFPFVSQTLRRVSNRQI